MFEGTKRNVLCGGRWAALVAGAALAAACHHPAHAATTDSPAAALARGWTEAFSAGPEPMRAFLGSRLAEASLAERSLEARMKSYADLRDRFGRLELVEVVEETATEVVAILRDGKEKEHEATFTIEPADPPKLRSIAIAVQHGFGR